MDSLRDKKPRQTLSHLANLKPTVVKYIEAIDLTWDEAEMAALVRIGWRQTVLMLTVELRARRRLRFL